MATIHVSGTKLSQSKVTVPLNRKFLIALAALFLLAMHFFMPNPGGSGLALSFNASTWIAFSFALGIGCYQLATNRVLRYSKLTIALLASCVIMTIPIFYPNANTALAANKLIGLWCGMLFFVVLQQFHFSNKHRQRLLWFIVLAVVIEATFGLVQYLYLQPGNVFGYNTEANRPYGIFQQPNVMASFLATGLVIASYLLARQPYKYSHKLSDVYLLYAVPVLTIPLIVALASRTGWLASIIAVLLIIPYMYRYATKGRFLRWVASLATGLLLSVTIMHMAFPDGGGLASEKVNMESPRTYTFPQALDMLIEKPFTGYGYGKFESEYMLYTARQHALNEHYPAGLPSMDHPHNELLYWGVEGGLLPILGIMLAMAIVLHRISQAKRGTRLALLALFIPIILHSQLEYPFYHSFVHWIIFIILLYWVDQRVSQYHQAPFSKVTKSLLRVCSLIIPAVISFYMISALHTNYILMKFETTRPTNPEILNRVTNPVVWKDRFDWDVYSTFLNIGLYKQDPSLIQPYIDWSLAIIKDKPRPAFYNNLILAYQGLNDSSKAEQIRAEAQFLFPKIDFSEVNYQPPSQAVSASPTSGAGK
ncbi:PglL family O-oligosaccharyltransferase [Vibrio alfacsensis]|uniref:PglL family O-oligosaccharyltransferase n=1 Tax=Vibrio alfacsensis TaxID=1074311 RepID=UPI002ADDDCFF|nr:PglL family O-oligosaccharyltransferase [Vibrio alfacsensis]WQE75920.1 PglL family O-oligosaccharyltransferase [Vibrio alfacsensis]